MLYRLDIGPSEHQLAKQYKQAGEQLPERIKNAPQLDKGLQFYMQAFYDLDTERSHAMGYTRIPWSAINSYAKALELDEEDRDDLIYLINAMDEAHIKRLIEKSKNGKKST